MNSIRVLDSSAWRCTGSVVFASLFALGAWSVFAKTDPQTPPAAKTGKAPAGKSSPFVADRGKLRITLDGQVVGTEDFEISPAGNDWHAKGKSEIKLPSGGAMIVSGQLKLAADGTPRRYEWSAQADKKASATVEFEGGSAKMALVLEGAQPFVQELSFGSPRVVILDNNLYHHYALLARLYDWEAKGPQTFSVLIPQDMTPGTITAESLGPQDLDGQVLELLRVRSADLEINLYLDSGHKLMRLVVPSSKVTVTRE
jgi:hypothetical protein